jgi:ribosomal protein L9
MSCSFDCCSVGVDYHRHFLFQKETNGPNKPNKKQTHKSRRAKNKKKSSAHFNLTNSTHETAVVRQLWVLLVAFVWC